MCATHRIGSERNRAVVRENPLRGQSSNPCERTKLRTLRDNACIYIHSQDTENAAVQLQGPFLIKKLTPPPAHQNVVMIAAGTGINPSERDRACPSSLTCTHVVISRRWDVLFAMANMLHECQQW